MRVAKWFVVLGFVQALTGSLQGQFSHLILVQQGEVAPLPLGSPPFNPLAGEPTFASFDGDRHYIDDSGRVVFRALLSTGDWGYWSIDETDLVPLFLEGDAGPLNLQLGTIYFGRDRQIFLHQTPLLAEGADQFFSLPNLDGIFPHGAVDQASLPGNINWEFAGSGVLANTIIPLPDRGHRDEIALATVQGRSVKVATGSAFSYHGRTYKTTDLRFPTATMDDVAAWQAFGEYENPKTGQTESISAIQVDGGAAFGIKTVFATERLDIATLSVGTGGAVAFHGRVNGSPWGIYAIGPLGGFRHLAEEGEPSTAGALKRFDMIRAFQVSELGIVTLMARGESRRWGIWSERIGPDGKLGLAPLVFEGMQSPHDSKLTVDQLFRAVANDRGDVAFVSRQVDSNGRFAGTTYWLAHFDSKTGNPVHEPIVTEFEPELILPDGVAVRGTDIVGLGANLNGSSPHGTALTINRRNQLSFRVQYTDPVNFETVDSIWLSAPPTLVVNHPGDAPDANPGDGVADIRENPEGGEPIGTLRAALEELNVSGAARRIEFRFGPEHLTNGTAIIKPLSPLPHIAYSVELDGSTQPGPDASTTGVIIDGSEIVAGFGGLVFTEADNSVLGLTIRGFAGNGISADEGTLRLTDVDIEDNRGAGVHAASLVIRATAARQSVFIQRNGEEGIVVEGVLNADRCHIQNNGGWGVLSEGSRVVLNQSDDTLIHIKENGSGGVQAMTATEVLGGRLSVTANGTKDPKNSYGIRAPKAHIDLFHSEIRDNPGGGIIGASAEVYGGLSLVEGNGHHGVEVAGDLVTEQIRVLRNKGWGILCGGNRLVINEEDDGPCQINENELGGLSFAGADLFVRDSEVSGNGKAADFFSDEGYGIFATAAATTLDDVKIRANEWEGVYTKDLTILGNLGEIRLNRASGIVTEGILTVEDRLVCSENNGWGLRVAGDSMKIGTALNPKQSVIENNTHGGIEFAGTLFEGAMIDILNNGSVKSPGRGVDAPRAEVTANGLRVVGHPGDGLRSQGLTLGGVRSEFRDNAGHGAHVNGDFESDGNCVISGNAGWGLIVEGSVAQIGLAPNPERSLVVGNQFGGIQFGGTTFRAWSLDLLNNGSLLESGGGLKAEDASVWLERVSATGNTGNGIVTKDLTLASGRAVFSENSSSGVFARGNFTAEENTEFSANKSWGIIIEGDSAQFGTNPTGARHRIDKNSVGGIQFAGTTLRGWSMDIRENGKAAVGAGIQAFSAAVALENSLISENSGAGIDAKSLTLKSSEVLRQGKDGVDLCPGPAVVDRVAFIGNRGSGLLICNIAGGGESVLTGLTVRDNHVDGIRNESAASMTISGSLFAGNGVFGVHNMFTRPNVVAIGNDWGHPSGPSGVGPGMGDPVSTNVIYQEPVEAEPLEISTVNSPFPIAAGTEAVVPIQIRHGDQREELTLRASDTQGWIQPPGGGLIQLSLVDGAVETELKILAPAETPVGQQSEVTLDVTVVSGSGLGQTGEAGLLVEVVSNEVEEPVSETPLPDPGNSLTQYRGMNGETLTFTTTGRSGQSLWGTNLYTDDSDLGVVAVHAGVLAVGETGTVKVLITPGQSIYQSTERNGILSQAFGSYAGSYQVFSSDTDLQADEELFNNGNIAGVVNEPSEETRIELGQRTFVTYLSTYHWNLAQGAIPGTLALQDEVGRVYGPWSVIPREGQGGVANANWDTWPNVTLDAGRYLVVDSDPASWSHNTDSGNQGFATLRGVTLGNVGAEVPGSPVEEPSEPAAPEPEPGGLVVLPDPFGNMGLHRGRNGETLYFEVTGTVSGGIWGTDVYTDDSILGVAAVHAGLIVPGETAVIAVTVLPGRANYEASERNGVSSSAFGAWGGSYRFETNVPDSSPPSLEFLSENGSLVVGWQSADDLWVLQFTDDLNAPVTWTDVPGTIREGTVSQFQIQVVEGQRFYRLMREGL